ncbi:hypothetical protein CFIMG_008045RA00001 [Ceratocystis fimbriata CBS 114723]|uniref:Uncharacterized protein n=1 Tax=Ceratocystis fimbriata CBS 114723 TaxID=1035309 RepID=A0A2C5X9S2_9PEZI|nr:hypothetical protein CFIMG_008045RA00001 [Ceratocystis fimbriata CBS 114723]
MPVFRNRPPLIPRTYFFSFCPCRIIHASFPCVSFLCVLCVLWEPNLYLRASRGTIATQTQPRKHRTTRHPITTAPHYALWAASMMSSLFSTAALPKRKGKNHQASDPTANTTAGDSNKPPYREVLYDNAGSPILAPDADDIIDGLDLPNDSPIHQHLHGTVDPRPNSTWTFSGTTAATTPSAPDSTVGGGSKKRRRKRNRKKRSPKGAETQENSAIESEPDLNTSGPGCSCSSNHANYQQHAPGPLSYQAYKPSMHPFYDPTSKSPHANKVKANKNKSSQGKEAEDSEKQPVKLKLGLNLKLDLELKAEIEGDITISLC